MISPTLYLLPPPHLRLITFLTLIVKLDCMFNPGMEFQVAMFNWIEWSDLDSDLTKTAHLIERNFEPRTGGG